MRPLSDLLPHRPPMSLVDRVVAADGTRVVGEKRVTADDPLLGAEGMGGPLLIEALAQTAACLMGLQNEGRGGHRGYLVAARGWKFPASALPGETVTLEAERVSALGGLHGFTARAHVDGRELGSGSLSFAVAFDDPPVEGAR